MKPLSSAALLLAAAMLAPVGVAWAIPSEPTAGGELTWRLDYDAAGRTVAITDPAGRPTRFGYGQDGQGRVRQVTRTNPDGVAVTRDLDEQGRLVGMRDGAGTVTYGYDDRGRLNRVARAGAAPVLYTYDDADRVKTLRIGDDYRVEYGYDFRGRLAYLETPAGRIRYEYLTGAGQVVRDLPNGIATRWRSGPDGTLNGLVHARRTDSDGRRHQVLSDYAYSYRPDGLIEAVTEGVGTAAVRRAFQYDPLGRLVRAKGAPRPQYVYGYDEVGNRTQTLASTQNQRHFSYDWMGRLTRVEGVATAHDAAGNLIALTLDGKTRRYAFDGANRLAAAGGGGVAYRYDGDGNLIVRTQGEKRLTFTPDPLATDWRPLIAEDQDGRRTLTIWDGAAPLLRISGARVEWLLHDHLSSVRLVADARGRIVRRIDYEPYGLMEDPTAAADLAPRFAGLFWDPVAEVYLARAGLCAGLGAVSATRPQARSALGHPGGSEPLCLLRQRSGELYRPGGCGADTGGTERRAARASRGTAPPAGRDAGGDPLAADGPGDAPTRDAGAGARADARGGGTARTDGRGLQG